MYYIHCDSNTLASYNQNTGKIVIVAVNATSETKTPHFHLMDSVKSVRLRKSYGQ